MEDKRKGLILENRRQLEKKEHINEPYAELIELMRIPDVEQAINKALTQILALLELEKGPAKQQPHNRDKSNH